MEYEIVTLQEQLVAGFTVRTNTHAPDVGRAIDALWRRYAQEGGEIPHRMDPRAICLYTDYAGGTDDDYTALTGCLVEREDRFPGHTLRRIPKGRYAKFVVRCSRDGMAPTVAGTWRTIWGMHLPRAFRCDFEVYQMAQGAETVEIHLYIGLKEAMEG